MGRHAGVAGVETILDGGLGWLLQCSSSRNLIENNGARGSSVRRGLVSCL